MFTVIIPFFNGHQYLDKLLSTIPDNIPILLVDDQSDKPLVTANHPNAQVMRMSQKGYFTGAVNQGIRACNTDVLILNQDVYFTDDSWLNWIDEQKKTFGIFGERAGSHPAWPERYVHGTFMYIKRRVINKTGLMDAVNYPLWGSTCEYQLRACRKGVKANPAKDIPGFVHERQGPYGSAIKETLAVPGNRGKFIRTPPLISVIITNYNYGRYLPDTVNSLIGGPTSLGDMPGQTLQSFEIIILDDGSKDDSIEIAQKLADPFKGIHLVTQKNRGSAAAANAGILASHARQDSLIAMLDADDMMEPERLATMVQAYQDNPHSAIYDNIQYFGNGQRGVVVDWQTGKKANRLDLGGYDFERQLHKNKIHKGLLYPRRAWEEAGGYPEIMRHGREDWAFNVALGINGWCGVNTGKYHYLYRREGQNRTLTNTTPRHHQRFLEKIKSLFPNIYAGERPMACCGKGPTKSASNGKAAAAIAKQSLPGQDGMVILEYLGKNDGDETWDGLVTKTRYVLGGSRKRGYVDKDDAYGDKKRKLRGLLDIREGGKKLFRLVPTEAPEKEIQPVAVQTEQLKKEIQPVQQPPEIVQQPVQYTEPDYEMILKTVNSVRDALPKLNPKELEKLLKQEKDGKGRSTAIRDIEAQLERVA